MNNEEKRKFAFLYLNTGAGHHAAAVSLQKLLLKKNPKLKIQLVNGFTKRNRIGRFVFEHIYRFTCNYLPGAYPLIYDISQYRWAQWLYVNLLLRYKTAHDLKRFIIQNHITDIVSFHFALTAALGTIMYDIPWKLNITVLVTDPFTAPHAWYYVRNLQILVYSQRVKEEAIECCGVSPDKIKIIPFLLDEKYKSIPGTKKHITLREKHGFKETDKIILLAGGGEGLPHALQLVKECIKQKTRYSIAVVCGRDIVKKDYLDVLKDLHPDIDFHIYGFVYFMDELMNIADLIVTKAGASMVMQSAALQKPVIISQYIHNQELGNMQYLIQNKVGWFIQNPKDIYVKIDEYFKNPAIRKNIANAYKKMKITTDVSDAVEVLKI